MIAVDTNVLLYDHRTEFKQHDAATAPQREIAEGPAGWALRWVPAEKTSGAFGWTR